MKVRNARAAELSDYEVLNVLQEMHKRQQTNATSSRTNVSASSTSSPFKQVTQQQQQQDVSSSSDERMGKGVAAIASDPSATDTATIGATAATLEERAMQSLPSNLRTIQYEVLATLGDVRRACAHQSSDHITRFMDVVYAWERGKQVQGITIYDEQTGGQHAIQPQVIEREKRLTKGERLMIVNHAPRAEIELYPLVEEIEDRFTAEQISALLAIVESTLPLDTQAMQAAQLTNSLEVTSAAAAEQEENGEWTFDEQTGQHVYVGHGENGGQEQEYEEDVADPADEEMDMLENEGGAGRAVDDDGPDDD